MDQFQFKAASRRLRLEPYDPDARDADNDGVLQEGTAWERPAGTQLVNALGNAIARGRSSMTRPGDLRVVDMEGNPVTYTPTYQRGAVQGRPTIGVPIGAANREPSVGERNGGVISNGPSASIGEITKTEKRQTIGPVGPRRNRNGR